MIPTPPDPFEEWFRQPVTEAPDDSPFIVRRARPDEFDRVYDTVDAAFGRKRPRALYRWLYLDNPMGIGRCWIVVERKSGDILKTGTSFPWPIWRGTEALMGSFGGDAATLPHWQRKGLSRVRRGVRNSHPWYDDMCGIAGPNANSRAVARSLGRSQTLLGRLRGGLALLRTGAALKQAKIPSLVASPVGFAADAFFSAWPGRRPKHSNESGAHVEPVARFTVDFDDATSRHMAWPKFWCPHNADFLNWRYLDHPIESYLGLVLLEDERPEGYAVIRLNGSGATLSEFVVGMQPREHAWTLLQHAISVAMNAGCAYLNFFATPGWRHWGLLRRAGFLPYVSPNFAEAACPRFEPEIQDMRNWQLLPGDRDYH